MRRAHFRDADLKVNCGTLGSGSALHRVSVHPDAIHDSKTEHNHKHEGTAVTDQGNGTSNGEHKMVIPMF
jgi:hypothetical protein